MKLSLGAAGAVFSAFLLSPAVTLADSVLPCPYVWNKNLKVGTIDPNVLKLQQFLNSNPETAIASSGPGSPGMETTKFGALTKKALIAFQNKHADDILVPNGLTSGTGIFGSATRAKMNALCSSAQGKVSSVLGTTTQVATSSLTVSYGAQPASSIAPQNALYVPFTNVTFTAGPTDVTVNSMVVERVGPGSDQAFFDIDLLDDEGSVVSTGYFQATHRAPLNDSFTIPAGTSKTFSLVGDMAQDLSSHDGEMSTLRIVSIDANAPLIGTISVSGTFQKMNSTLTIGTANVQLSGMDPQTSRIRYINDTGVTFSGIRIEAGSREDLRFDSMTWELNGSVSSADIGNVQTIVNGVAYPAETSDGRYYTSVFPGGISISKGNSIEASVRADLLGTGSNRTAQFDIHFNTDIVLYGKTYGYGIGVAPGGNTGTAGTGSAFITADGTKDTGSLSPFFQGSRVTVSGAAIVNIGR